MIDADTAIRAVAPVPRVQVRISVSGAHQYELVRVITLYTSIRAWGYLSSYQLRMYSYTFSTSSTGA